MARDSIVFFAHVLIGLVVGIVFGDMSAATTYVACIALITAIRAQKS